MLHAPVTLRALVRTDEIWLTILACGVGLLAGLLVVGINETTLLMHRVLFALSNNGRLSGLPSVDPWRAVLVPTGGGLLLGLFGILVAKIGAGRPVDPVEANALHGGRMSLRDSIIVVLQTVLSNGVGASIGLEAGYSQIGAALSSKLGRSFRVRRGDLRVLVGCGAAAAIGAAFDAPIAGAFYAFELVIGTYALVNLAPVTLASITAVIVTNLLGVPAPTLDLTIPTRIAGLDYLPVLALGVVSALVGITIMYAVTLTEAAFRRSRVPGWMRPMIGGLAVGSMALVSPAVMSSGHAAMALGLNAQYDLRMAALLLVLKACGAAISIGSGFRGGLFFASLFLGVLTGTVFGDLLLLVSSDSLSPVVCALIAMAAMAATIVGGPLTMVFLVLESTGSLPLTSAVLAASVVASVTTRRTFGYSFATWRFHLRGESIRSAVDVGWIRNLTVGRMMRREVRTIRIETSLAALRRDFPLGSEHRLVIVDNMGRYAGILQVPELHSADENGERLADFLHNRDEVLLPQMTVKDAVSRFETAEADALVVVDDPETRTVIGLLTEQYALRRYTEELDRSRRDLSGDV
ncbi:chloride channel protein [Acetobacteraceae bacterium KSS12]|uniref:Chloride channel protein n=1 Tax=Rhizosaccharibacter radicis TaxID=2782605 RepID=A0ABT1VXE7_9PROT|nr:chloride channel protein [Acetobacteraceae bacterium KSS12]